MDSMWAWAATFLILPPRSLLRRADGFGSLVGIVAVCRLQLVDKRDVSLISIRLGCAGIDLFLPCLLLRLALWSVLSDLMLASQILGGLRTLRSNMPGAVALEISSPLATLKSA